MNIDTKMVPQLTPKRISYLREGDLDRKGLIKVWPTVVVSRHLRQRTSRKGKVDANESNLNIMVAVETYELLIHARVPYSIDGNPVDIR